ncbi:MAG: hypothetical protein M1455_08160 [Actinobacteria bacterium]|nr:hypothetical protein [Actinomycetota bacterium]
MATINTWSASIPSPPQKEDGKDLSALAGRWDQNLKVSISMPSVLTQGPVINSYINGPKNQKQKEK